MGSPAAVIPQLLIDAYEGNTDAADVIDGSTAIGDRSVGFVLTGKQGIKKPHSQYAGRVVDAWGEVIVARRGNVLMIVRSCSIAAPDREGAGNDER
jgi:hypothetical protein